MDYIKAATLWAIGLPFLPKLAISFLIVGLAVLVLLVLWMKPIGEAEENARTSDADLNAVQDIKSQFEAASNGSYSLDCSRYIALANPNITTKESRTCSALAELRTNMTSLAATRNALKSDTPSWLPPNCSVSKTRSYLNLDFKHLKYGVSPLKAQGLLDDASNALSGLDNLSLALYDRWSTDTSMTLDDLFVAFGFLEWAISIDASSRVTPSEMYKMGPFYDVAFSFEIVSNRYFTDYFSVDDDYTSIVGMVD